MTAGPTQPPEDDAWSSGTFQGAEREQLRVWSQLPLRRKLEALEEMCDHARRTIASRKARHLPYIDPFSGEAVAPARASAVQEEKLPHAASPAGSLTFVRGDATQPITRPAVIVHVCNDVGGWGAGFVLAISKRWKAPEREYRAAFATASPRPQLGDVQFVAVEPGLWVANMIAQRGIRRGANGEPPIRYDAVRSGLRKVTIFAQEQRASAHLPRIGCGLAGGKWEEIEPIIRETLLPVGVDVTVYDFP